MTATRGKAAQEFQAGQGYTQEDWEAVSDSPDLTEEELATLRPAQEVLPPTFFEGLGAARAEAQRGRGRPRSEAAKVPVTLRLEPDVLDRFKAAGGDWRQRMQDALRKATLEA
ncbi:BrnA antitoxin family protein [Aureimonas leprariae]|uniref:BrnA antitoxin family protein n=2 Tax=Plantimonas leprariae TaxID=2615207 RepID=A0A7V7PQH8_9HYPH|nr:BrnA antitoxin family protein [Aureimonas leprariae]KAB0680416.1 BrnA antitoxin family protein [Aureimonas leprariae]